MSEMYRQIHHKWSVRAKNMAFNKKRCSCFTHSTDSGSTPCSQKMIDLEEEVPCRQSIVLVFRGVFGGKFFLLTIWQPFCSASGAKETTKFLTNHPPLATTRGFSKQTTLCTLDLLGNGVSKKIKRIFPKCW